MLHNSKLLLTLYSEIKQILLVIKYIDKMKAQKRYITGRNSERFTDFDKAKEYADKWKDKSISVYVNGLYHSTVHKKDGEWGQKK